MKTLTMEKIIALSPDADDCCSFAAETVRLRRIDEPGGTFLSMECANLEPDDEYGPGVVTMSTREAVELARGILQFVRQVRIDGKVAG